MVGSITMVISILKHLNGPYDNNQYNANNHNDVVPAIVVIVAYPHQLDLPATSYALTH